MSGPSTTVLKLGGSVITRKDAPETVDEGALADAAGAIGEAVAERERGGGEPDLVVVHGGGSFGHHHADRHGITTEVGSRDAAALVDVHGAMTDLNARVIESLQAESVPALPVSPLSFARRDGEGSLALPPETVRAMTGEGFVPVVHGDVVVQAGAGGTVLSGDDVVVSLARSLGAERVGLCSSVPGVLDGSGAVIDRIDGFEEVADALGASRTTDVTGGMARKVRRLLALEGTAHVFGPDRIGAFLAGGEPGTAIRGSEP